MYELPPNTQGIAALMMLNLMERFPLGEYGFHSAKALHVMIEAKKLAYADMITYVADPGFAKVPVPSMLSKEHAATARDAHRSGESGVLREAFAASGPDELDRGRHDLPVGHRSGRQHRVAHSEPVTAASAAAWCRPSAGFMLQNRGALFTLEANHPNVLAPRKRPLHTIIPAFMQKGDVRIGFGIMGGFNQAQAHAQFVANIADYGMDIQEALEAGRFTKGSFDGCDVAYRSPRARGR